MIHYLCLSENNSVLTNNVKARDPVGSNNVKARDPVGSKNIVFRNKKNSTDIFSTQSNHSYFLIPPDRLPTAAELEAKPCFERRAVITFGSHHYFLHLCFTVTVQITRLNTYCCCSMLDAFISIYFYNAQKGKSAKTDGIFAFEI